MCDGTSVTISDSDRQRGLKQVLSQKQIDRAIGDQLRTRHCKRIPNQQLIWLINWHGAVRWQVVSTDLSARQQLAMHHAFASDAHVGRETTHRRFDGAALSFDRSTAGQVNCRASLRLLQKTAAGFSVAIAALSRPLRTTSPNVSRSDADPSGAMSGP